MGIQLIYYNIQMKIDKTIENTSSLFYENPTDLIHYIQSTAKTEMIFLVLSVSSARDILNVIHDLRQLDSIFLFPSNNDQNEDEEFIEKYSKIIGVFPDFNDLLASIEENRLLVIQQTESLKFYEQRQKSTRELSKEAGAFFWLRLFKEVVLQLPHDDQAKQEMIDKLKEQYRNNNKQLKSIEKFNQEYKSADVIRWYTKEPFLYKQLNRALRTEDIELLYKFRYFISDLSRQLSKEFEILCDSYSSKICFYRGVILSKEEIEKLKNNVGQLISTNGYLSTSLSKDVALSYVDLSRHGKEQSVLFDVEYDFGRIDSIIIAGIAEYSQHPDEQEILFDLDAVFQLDSVTMHPTLNLFVVKMSVNDQSTTIVREHLVEIGKDIRGSSAVLVFGRLLGQIGQHEKAERYFNSLLNNPGDEDLSYIYYYLGSSQVYQGYYEKALNYYNKALTTMNNAEKPRPFPSSFVLNDMGVVYKTIGQYDQALDYFKRCLEIRTNYSEYPTIASSLENLAAIYRVKGDYDHALELHRECFRIREEHLPKEHRQIAKSLSNIGAILMDQDQLNMALEYHQKSLEISKKSLPAEHDDIALCLNRIGHVVSNQGKPRQALDHYLRALEMKEHLFPHGHLTTAITLASVGYTYYLLKDYQTALAYLRRALNLRESLFSDIHDDSLVNLLNYLGLVFTKLYQHEDSLIYYQRAYTIAQSIYPVGHTRLTDCLTNLGICFREMKDYRKAFDYFEKASKKEEENSISPNLINLARTYDNMGICLSYQNADDQGLRYRMKAVRMMADVTPRPHHATWIDSVGDICFIQDQYEEALECYFQSLSIRVACQTDDVLSMAENFTNIAGVFAQLKKTPSHQKGYLCSIKARFYYESALTIYRKIKHPNAADILYSLGSMYEQMKFYRRALNYYQQGLAVHQPTTSFENIARNTLQESIVRMRWFICE